MKSSTQMRERPLEQLLCFCSSVHWPAATFVVLSVQRCCFQREIGSLQSPYQDQKLECEAAIDTVKENMEKLAKGQGKRRADLYFSTTSKTNPLIRRAKICLSKPHQGKQISLCVSLFGGLSASSGTGGSHCVQRKSSTRRGKKKSSLHSFTQLGANTKKITHFLWVATHMKEWQRAISTINRR